jgi:hypothetical protein
MLEVRVFVSCAYFAKYTNFSTSCLRNTNEISIYTTSAIVIISQLESTTEGWKMDGQNGRHYIT